ncbi:GIY-YIG nuclease family protein [Patescibacteria group bacterium]
MIKTISKIKKIKISKENFKYLPKNPGIYIFWQKNKVIYIGKAINLKNRLNSYLQIKLDLKTKKMMSIAEKTSYIKVENELEALLLESFLIKKYQPKYNIIAKDDKSPLYIKITKEKYPRIITARKVDEKNKDYISFFGPFPSSKVVKDVLKLLRKAFPYSDHKIAKKACIYSQIGLCNPCPSMVEGISIKNEAKLLKDKYNSRIKILNSILNGNYRKIQKELSIQMNKLSAKQRYEEAKEINNQLKMLEYITQPIIRPKYFSDNPYLTEDLRKKEINSLALIIKNISNKEIKLNRIECFDISHISGVSTAASMVVYTKGQEDKKSYRHFKIRQQNTLDDLSSLKEVAERRLKHLKDWGKPDLVIVDGGLTQTKIFHEIFADKDIFVIGIAKRFETLVIPRMKDNKIEYIHYVLPKSPARNFIQRIRNEAHRFAQRYHHKMFSKRLINGSLT